MSNITDLKRWFAQPLVTAILATTFLALPVVAAEDNASLIVSPIISQPSGEVHAGELVWADLLTTDPQQAVDFYSTVFEWQPRFFTDQDYVELSHDGRVICSVVLYEDDEAVAGDARWLVSISVKDVDGAIQKAVENGGEVLKPATDLPDRGRYSVISDAQGAVLMLLRATGGGRPDIPDIPRGPSASQMPDFGMPGGGMMDAGPMDMGGFDF